MQLFLLQATDLIPLYTIFAFGTELLLKDDHTPPYLHSLLWAILYKQCILDTFDIHDLSFDLAGILFIRKWCACVVVCNAARTTDKKSLLIITQN